MDREGLVLRAQAAGIRRARVLTRPELIDELLRLDPVVDEAQLKKSRGFFGRARDLLSRVVERGLHLPDAAERLRGALGTPPPQVPRPEPHAIPTVTLAEIYAAQGHKDRAIQTLERVLEAEPDHARARALLDKLQAKDYVAPPPPLPPEPEEEPPPAEPDVDLEMASREEVRAPVDAEPDPEASVPTAPVGEPESGPRTPARGPAAHGGPPRTLRHAEEPPRDASPELEEPPTLPRKACPAELPDAPAEAECIAIPIEGGGSYVWWRLTDDKKEELAARSFVVRAAIFVPTWDGPKLQTRDVACDPAAGEHVLRDLPEGAVVRVAIGWVEDDGFTPVAHSPALETSPSRGLVRWTVKGHVPVVPDDPLSASILRAAAAAARVTAT
jgi:hypothetical protein